MIIASIADLTDPITTAKVDWLPGTTWMGFTPASDAPNAFAKCQSTINRQIHNGLVIEYITLNFPTPNPGHETDPECVDEKHVHSACAGCLVGVHRLRPTARNLHGYRKPGVRKITGPVGRGQDTKAMVGRLSHCRELRNPDKAAS